MAATFGITIDNGTATYTLTGSAPKQKVLDTAEDAAHYVYPRRYQLYEDEEKQVPIPFDDLAQGQKKSIIALEFIYYMEQLADAYYINNAADTARGAARDEADDKYGLD